MLTKIWFEAFKEADRTRPEVSFHSGLNTIRGGQGAENSIGKSTLLYIIDYAFGGSQFLQTDTLKAKAVGHHRICFTFEFDSKAYHFSRHTSENDYVRRYSDPGYVPMELNEFKGWLKRKYGLSGCDSLFREIISRFFRIKQSATAHADLPLQGYSREPVTTGMSVLYQLFGLYDEIRGLQEAFKETDENWKAVEQARDIKAFPVKALHTKKEYEQALKDSDRLSREYETNIKAADQETLDLQAIQLMRAANLKTDLRSLRSQLGRIHAQITKLKASLESDTSAGIVSTDIESLAKFFPRMNLVTIQDAQRFHKKITRIVTGEIEAQIDTLEGNANHVERLINEAKYQLRATGVPVENSRERLARGARISAEREILTQQTKSYELINEFKQVKTTAEHNLDEGRAQVNTEVVKRLNPTISKLDKQVCGGEDDWDTPTLRFSSTGKSYEYKSDTDGGDGTTNKNLILFDIVMLTLTSLTAVIHDSPLHKNISDERIEQILRLYMEFNNTNKQIFIAFDKDTQYEGTQVHELVNASKVIEIEDGEHALYGWTWNKKRKGKNK